MHPVMTSLRRRPTTSAGLALYRRHHLPPFHQSPSIYIVSFHNTIESRVSCAQWDPLNLSQLAPNSGIDSPARAARLPLQAALRPARLPVSRHFAGYRLLVGASRRNAIGRGALRTHSKVIRRNDASKSQIRSHRHLSGCPPRCRYSMGRYLHPRVRRSILFSHPPHQCPHHCYRPLSPLRPIRCFPTG